MQCYFTGHQNTLPRTSTKIYSSNLVYTTILSFTNSSGTQSIVYQQLPLRVPGVTELAIYVLDTHDAEVAHSGMQPR